MILNDEYVEKLISLASEIHEFQLKESEKMRGRVIDKVHFDQFVINSKINYLTGYIMALQSSPHTDQEE